MGEGAIWGMNEKREETESSPTTNCRLLQLLFFFVDFFGIRVAFFSVCKKAVCIVLCGEKFLNVQKESGFAIREPPSSDNSVAACHPARAAGSLVQSRHGL